MTGHSVIIPVLNGSRFIGEALRSALPQLEADDEVLVVDNGSTDDTLSVVRAVGDPRIAVLHQPKAGPAAARNMGIEAARGAFISFLDHDDMWPAGRTAGLMGSLAGNPEAQSVIGRMQVRFEPGTERLPNYTAFEGRTTDLAFLGPYMFRAGAVAAVGPFNETMRYGEDVDFLLRARSTVGPPMIWDGDCFIYRRHETNMTNDRPATNRGALSVLAQHLARNVWTGC